jgi:hypothetical protein
MQLIILLLLMSMSLLAELSDPGANLATSAERRAARVSVWQPQYEALSAEQVENQARQAVEDLYDPVCLLAVIRDHMGDPQATQSAADEYLEDRLSALLTNKNLAFLEDHCGPPAFTGSGNVQGEARRRVLVIRGVATSNGLRSMLPVLPRIEDVPPLVWGAMSEGTCTINSTTGACFAAEHDWHEAHLHLLEAIIRAEGQETRFALLPPQTCVGEGESQVCTSWRDTLLWEAVIP